MMSRKDVETYIVMNTGDADVVYWPLYDTLTWGEDQKLDFFVNPISPTKSEAETNMFVGSELPNTQGFVCNGISLIFSRHDASVMQSGYLMFIMGSRVELLHGPLNAFVRPFPEVRSVAYSFPVPFGFVYGQKFGVSLCWRDPPRKVGLLKIKCELDGMLYRPVV